MAFEQKQRIRRDEFNKIINSIPDISDKEQEYLNQIFGSYLIDGLTEWEIKDKINKLRYNQKDVLDQWELEKLRNKLLSILGK